MPTSKTKQKRALSPASSKSSPPEHVITGLFECFNFISPNDYSERTFGLLAFLLRKSVGDINFSEVVSEVEKRSPRGGCSSDYIHVLEEKRQNLSESDVSIEECLMINRLISYIKENEAEFNTFIAHLRQDMRVKLKDNQTHGNIQYPTDFRQRETDFFNRIRAQDLRHLFFFSHNEIQQPPSLIQLAKRTTEHLNYVIDCMMNCEPSTQYLAHQELENILQTSFMMTEHPHYGSSPVITYDLKEAGPCKVNISVIIVSLLFDFMETHPNVISLLDIETTLCPPSTNYKVECSPISWKTCKLEIEPGEPPRYVTYAELNSLTIQCLPTAQTRLHLSEDLYSIQFGINLNVTLPDRQITVNRKATLESLNFGIGSDNYHASTLLTKIILKDIHRFSQCPSSDVETISHYILRYFMHRTGVRPHQQLKKYLVQELSKAKNEIQNCERMEDIFMDFLVPFIHQVEFMNKHPIISMFYADSLCLGICDSGRVADVLKKSTDCSTAILGIRLNSIKTDKKSNGPASFGNIPCFVRVDIYNNRTKNLQYRTFDYKTLAVDIKKFVDTAYSGKGNHIRVLSNLDDRPHAKNYRSYGDFDKYYHERLNQIHRVSEEYKPITDVIQDVENDDNDDDVDDDRNINQSITCSIGSLPEWIPEDLKRSPSTSSNLSEKLSRQSSRTLSPPASLDSLQHMNSQHIIEYCLSQPDVLSELLQRLNSVQLSSELVPPQQYPFYPSEHQPSYPFNPQQPSTMQYYQQYVQLPTSAPSISNQMNSGVSYETFQPDTAQVFSHENQMLFAGFQQGTLINNISQPMRADPQSSIPIRGYVDSSVPKDIQ